MHLNNVVNDLGAETEARTMRPIRVGIFGCMRGSNFPKSVLMNNGEIVALCDRSIDKMEEASRNLPERPAFYTDFEAFQIGRAHV